MSFELEIGKQLHSMELGLLNFKKDHDDKQMILDFFQFVILYCMKLSFRIFPGPASWLTQDPVLFKLLYMRSHKNVHVANSVDV